ncbi:hypothetical protein TNCV_2689691 [Trichonephila clavipes]|uniref:Uncharacterized protein n=1 Tax=Trichonephila clavipes TaxID=2585209 RepID=A0A8X6VYG5_TRICX|nr:hypothetical protein TNCV_2689691 [Trichonephila clavipes]
MVNLARNLQCHVPKQAWYLFIDPLKGRKAESTLPSPSRGSLVVKVTDSWPVCHEFKPCTTEDPPFSGGRCTLNLSRLKRPPLVEVWKLGEKVPAQVSSSSLDHASKLRDPSPKALE